MSKAAMCKTLGALFPETKGMPRAEVLYDLAKEASDGAIVEIGTHHGFGAIALASGSRDGAGVPIYTVDPSEPAFIWTGHTMYGQGDRAVLLRNLLEANVTDLVRIVGLDARQAWAAFKEDDISLLFWDIGISLKKPGMKEAIDEWITKIRVGGILALGETFGGHLGTDDYIADLVKMGTYRQKNNRYAIRIAERI